MKDGRPVLFRAWHFEPEIIVTCVRCYLRFSLSLQVVEELMPERGLAVDRYNGVCRWCQKVQSCRQAAVKGELLDLFMD
jgi:transposase-like protein